MAQQPGMEIGLGVIAGQLEKVENIQILKYRFRNFSISHETF
jgi:hypothetical protein